MTENTYTKEMLEPQRSEPVEELSSEIKLSRRTFVQMLGAGLLITVTEGVSLGQRRSRGGRSITVAARLHLTFMRNKAKVASFREEKPAKSETQK